MYLAPSRDIQTRKSTKVLGKADKPEEGKGNWRRPHKPEYIKEDQDDQEVQGRPGKTRDDREEWRGPDETWENQGRLGTL